MRGKVLLTPSGFGELSTEFYDNIVDSPPVREVLCESNVRESNPGEGIPAVGKHVQQGLCDFCRVRI